MVGVLCLLYYLLYLTANVICFSIHCPSQSFFIIVSVVTMNDYPEMSTEYIKKVSKSKVIKVPVEDYIHHLNLRIEKLREVIKGYDCRCDGLEPICYRCSVLKADDELAK